MRSGTILGSIVTVLALSLAACSPGSGPRALTAASATAEPTREPLNLEQASEHLKKICFETSPSFDDAEAALRAGSFVRNTRTGTYFHPTLDLSFNLRPVGGKPGCSMVFVSNEDANQLALLLAIGSQFNVEEDRKQIDIGVDPKTGAASAEMGNGQVFLFRPRGTSRKGKKFYSAFVISMSVTGA